MTTAILPTDNVLAALEACKAFTHALQHVAKVLGGSVEVEVERIYPSGFVRVRPVFSGSKFGGLGLWQRRAIDIAMMHIENDAHWLPVELRSMKAEIGEKHGNIDEQQYHLVTLEW